MLTRRFSAAHRRALRLRSAMCCASCLLLIVVVSQISLGQNPRAIVPADQAQSGLPNSGKAKTTTATTAPTEQASVEPLTRQLRESSMEINPADQRIMSDIQEIRAMLGGGLKAEFEEIDQTLRQYHPAVGDAASPSPANDRPVQQRAAEGHGTTDGDWFSRELGKMVRTRSRLLAAPDQDDSRLTQQTEGLKQPVAGKSDTRSALRQCARELEAVAASLEQIEAYENADSVRQEAAGLWEKARQ